MAWITLILGVLLMAIGIGGQIFGTRKSSTLAPADRHIRKWIFTVGSLVVGLWVVAFSAARFLHHHH
jgi:hypothetical protein